MESSTSAYLRPRKAGQKALTMPPHFQTPANVEVTLARKSRSLEPQLLLHVKRELDHALSHLFRRQPNKVLQHQLIDIEPDKRHAAASELLEQGAPLTVVQRQLRHRDARTTLQKYGHVVGDAQRRAVETLAENIERHAAVELEPSSEMEPSFA